MHHAIQASPPTASINTAQSKYLDQRASLAMRCARCSWAVTALPTTTVATGSRTPAGSSAASTERASSPGPNGRVADDPPPTHRGPVRERQISHAPGAIRLRSTAARHRVAPKSRTAVDRCEPVSPAARLRFRRRRAARETPRPTRSVASAPLRGAVRHGSAARVAMVLHRAGTPELAPRDLAPVRGPTRA